MIQVVIQTQKKIYYRRLKCNLYLSLRKLYQDYKYLKIEKLNLINGHKLKLHITKTSFLMKMFYLA